MWIVLWPEWPWPMTLKVFTDWNRPWGVSSHAMSKRNFNAHQISGSYRSFTFVNGFMSLAMVFTGECLIKMRALEGFQTNTGLLYLGGTCFITTDNWIFSFFLTTDSWSLVLPSNRYLTGAIHFNHYYDGTTIGEYTVRLPTPEQLLFQGVNIHF